MFRGSALPGTRPRVGNISVSSTDADDLGRRGVRFSRLRVLGEGDRDGRRESGRRARAGAGPQSRLRRSGEPA